MEELSLPVDLIWGAQDPWEPITEAEHWAQTQNCVQSLSVIDNAGHCPHDEAPDQVNRMLLKLVRSEPRQTQTC